MDRLSLSKNTFRFTHQTQHCDAFDVFECESVGESTYIFRFVRIPISIKNKSVILNNSK